MYKKNMNKKLEILEKDKSVIFLSPFTEDETNLTRTGVIKENSFFHSILLSYSKEYLELNDDDKNNFIKKLKDSLFSKKNLINNNYSDYKSNLLNIFDLVYNYISDANIENSELVKIIISKISINKVYNLFIDIIPYKELKYILDNNTDTDISLLKKNLTDNIKKYLKTLDILKYVDDKKYKFIKDNILIIIDTILDETENDMYKYYLNNISTIDEFVINLTSNRLKINIYIFNSKNRIPSIYKKFNYKKSIIILQIGNNYEGIGMIKNNRIKRIFDSNDILIQKINMFLFEPDKIEDEFPELITYLSYEDNIDETWDTIVRANDNIKDNVDETEDNVDETEDNVDETQDNVDETEDNVDETQDNISEINKKIIVDKQPTRKENRSKIIRVIDTDESSSDECD